MVIVGLALGGVASAAGGTRTFVRAGDFIRVAGTQIVCRVTSAGDGIQCFRVTGATTSFAAGGYLLELNENGQVMVHRRVGSKWSLVYARVPAAAARVYVARPGERFRVSGTRIGCNVGKSSKGGFVQCGLIAGADRLRLPGSVGFEYHADGSFGVVEFDATGGAKTTFTRSDADHGRGVLRLSTSANITIAVDASAVTQIGCGGATSQGLKLMTCGRFTNGTGSPYTFALREDGVAAVFDASSGTPKPLFALPGVGRPRGTLSEAPTHGAVFAERPGGVFKLAGTLLTCTVIVRSGTPAVRCGFADTTGVGSPIPNAVEIDGDGVIRVLRYDAHRHPRQLFATPKP